MNKWEATSFFVGVVTLAVITAPSILYGLSILIDRKDKKPKRHD